jgi:hypothetical protein
MTIFLVALACAVAAVGGSVLHFVGINYRNDIVGEATKLVGALTVITTFVERSTAVLGTIWFEDRIAVARARVAVAEQLARDDPAAEEHREELRASAVAFAQLEAEKARMRAWAALFIALLVSAVGVRTLERLQNLEGVAASLSVLQLGLYRSTDILITAGLIAGGSAGIAAIAGLIARLIHNTGLRLQRG